MNEDDVLSRFGLHPSSDELEAIRDLLREQIAKEHQSQGNGDTELMKLFCVHLFNAGSIEDVLLVWSAKTSSMDADASIEVRLLCGAGLPETKAFLARQPDGAASRALERIKKCETSGDFEGFVTTEVTAEYTEYYSDEEDEHAGFDRC